MTTIATASREYANRPADERFPSVQALVDNALTQQNASKSVAYNLKDLKIVTSASAAGTERPMVQSPKGVADMSHWAFGQFSRMIGAPAAYLRTLPADIAARAMNHGIAATPAGTTAQLLVQAPNGRPTPLIRAATSKSYGRVWDAALYSAVNETLCKTDARWTLPPTWTGESAGAYRGDRDSFLILVNGGSIVTDPSIGAGTSGISSSAGIADRGMYRGLLIRNSEVGAAAITIESILFRYVCGNHMLWGAMVDKQFRRRHVGATVVRDTMREIYSFARSFSERPESADTAIITHLIEHELAHTEAACIDELKTLGATKDQATKAYASCVQHEAASPRSFWGLSQGLTRLSQESGFQDERYSLDQLAGRLMAKGMRSRVAV